MARVQVSGSGAPPRAGARVGSRVGTRRLAVAVLAILASTSEGLAAGVIDGLVLGSDGNGLGGVSVLIEGEGREEVTDDQGRFRFERLDSGRYALVLSLDRHQLTDRDVEVIDGEVTSYRRVVDWPVRFFQTITVTAASRRPERAIEAPTGATALEAEAIADRSVLGELPKLFEFEPGIQIAQSGVFSFDLNTRGFNSFGNRRMAVRLDGRDPSLTLSDSLDWSTLGMELDLERAELVYGPSSALYGANAFNGVVKLVTRAPRDSLGGQLKLAAGEHDFSRADLRWSTRVTGETYAKLFGTYSEGRTFNRSRTASTEYEGLPLEAVELPTRRFDSYRLGLRLDGYVGGNLLSLETVRAERRGGGVLLGGTGRNFPSEGIGSRWWRLAFEDERLEVRFDQTDWLAANALSLSTGARAFDDSRRRHAEVQTRDRALDGKLLWILGGSRDERRIDSSNRAGVQTTLFEPVETQADALYVQADLAAAERLTVSLAARWDDDSRYGGRLSPKLGLRYALNPRHSLRLAYNEAFQAPNHVEGFVNLPIPLPLGGPPVSAIDLSGVERGVCAPFGVDCGFAQPTEARAVGNRALEVEEITTLELGVSSLPGERMWISAGYYRSRIENLVTDFLPNPRGRVNPAFGAYLPPADHPRPDLVLAALAEALGPLSAFLSRNLDDRPIFALVSLTNAGRVDSQGFDVALRGAIGTRWRWRANYAWFDFSVEDPGLQEDLQANRARHQLGFGVGYVGARAKASLDARWVEGFRWVNGVFVGPVPGYVVVDVTSSVALGDRSRLGIRVSNLTNDLHYQAFGGDLLERQARVFLDFRW